jgi:hypothetical protein
VSIRPFIDEALKLLRLPHLRLEMSGDERARELYRAFTRRHARWRLIRNKTLGVALLAIPDSRAAYEDHAGRHLRRNVKYAKRAGLAVHPIDPLRHVDRIMEIHRSAPDRQGRPLHPAYLDDAEVRAYLAGAADVLGVLDASAVLQGYVCLRACGDIVVVERVIGHLDARQTGAMYLLFSGAVDWLIERRAEGAPARWLMYDMVPGSTPGMRTFKHVIGFRPYRVSWRWRAR